MEQITIIKASDRRSEVIKEIPKLKSKESEIKNPVEELTMYISAGR